MKLISTHFFTALIPMLVTSNAMAQVTPSSEQQKTQILNMRARIAQNPGAYSWNDRQQLRNEAIRHPDFAEAKTPVAEDATLKIQQMRSRIHNTDQSKRVLKYVKTGVDYGLKGLDAYITVSTAGAGKPLATATTKGLGYMLNYAFAEGERSMEENFQKQMAYGLSTLPRGTLKTKAEAQAWFLQNYGGDHLLLGLPPDIQARIDKDPTLRVTYQNNFNERIAAYAMKIDERVLDLQGRTQEHDIKIADLQMEVRQTSIFLTEFSIHTNERLSNLESAQKDFNTALKDLSELVGKNSADIKTQTKDIDYMKSWMTGKMSARELVQASESGFLSFDKEQLNQIKFTAKVEAFQSSATQVFQLGNDFVTLATHFKMNPKFVSGVAKTVKYAMAATNLATSIASGNVFGAVSALTGFFSGPDIAAERHREVMEALGDIHKLQVQILQNQAAISKQIENLHNALLKTHREVMGKLDQEFARVHVNVGSVQTLSTRILMAVKLQSCDNIFSSYAQVVRDERDVLSDLSLQSFFARASNATKAQECRDGYFGMFLDTTSRIGHALERSKPDALLVNGIQLDDRSRETVDAQHNADANFRLMINIVQGFHDLAKEEFWSTTSVFPALLAATPSINDAILRTHAVSSLKDSSDLSKFFENRLQPVTVVELAKNFRTLHPLLNRVSSGSFLSMDQLDITNTDYALGKKNNLKLLNAVYEHIKVAEAQERLSGGTFMIPLLSRYLMNPKAMEARFVHEKRTDLQKTLGINIAQAIRKNAYLAQNLALYRMSMNFDNLVRFDRQRFLLSGGTSVGRAHDTFAKNYRKAFADGNVAELRNLLPPEWRVLCDEDFKDDITHRWKTSFHPSTTCRSEQNEQVYMVRLKGIADVLGADFSDEHEIYFSLPAPDYFEGERFLRSSDLIALEEEAAAYEQLIVENQPMREISQPALKDFDLNFLGGI